MGKYNAILFKCKEGWSHIMEGSIKELSKYRFERAIEELDNAKAMLDTNRYKLALNRSYYSIFHCMRAVNTIDAFDSSKHSSIIAHFNQYHVKTEDFPKAISKIIRDASEMREHADYEDFYIASSCDAEKQVQNAEQFLKEVQVYLKKMGVL